MGTRLRRARLVALGAFSPLVVWAGNLHAAVIVESSFLGQNNAWYREGTSLPDRWRASALKSTAPDLTTTAGSRFYTGTLGAFFEVIPQLPEAGGAYWVDVTHGDSTAIDPALVVGVQVTGGTGLPPTTGILAYGGFNTWERLGMLTLDPGVTTPTVRFLIPAITSNVYADAVRFTPVPEPGLGGAVLLAALVAAGRRKKRMS